MDKESLGNFISEKRKEKKMTQKELADQLNVSITTVSKWETGKNFPDIAICEPLSIVLGITLSEFFTQTNHPNDNKLINDQLESCMKNFMNVVMENNKNVVKSKRRAIKLNYFLIFLIVTLIIVLFTIIYTFKPPSFTTVYSDSIIEEDSNNIKQIVYNLHVYIKGGFDKEDIKNYSNLITTKWVEGAYISENPDIIHIYFYNNPKGYKKKNYIAEVILLHP